MASVNLPRIVASRRRRRKQKQAQLWWDEGDDDSRFPSSSQTRWEVQGMAEFYAVNGRNTTAGYRNTTAQWVNNSGNLYNQVTRAAPSNKRDVELGGIAQSGVEDPGYAFIPWIWEDVSWVP